MAFTFLPNIPAATDLISSSQAEIQENFQYLGDTAGNAVAGYYKLPNGLILNWGNEGPAGWTTSGSDFLKTISFNQSYTTAIYAVYLTPRVGDAQSKRFVIDSVTPPTTSQFVIRASTLSFSTIYWFSIGV